MKKNAFTATAPAAYTNSFAAAFTVAAMLGLAAGAKTANAWDRQATDAAMSTEINNRAAQGLAPRHDVSGAYASAHSHQRGADAGVARRDFQLEGR
jgi:hypothetical protein